MLQRRVGEAKLKACLDWLFMTFKNLTNGLLSQFNDLSTRIHFRTNFFAGSSPRRHLSAHPSTSPAPSPLSPLLLVLLCCSLAGCSVFNSGPPASVVEQAVAQKLVQTQSLLRQQLSDAAPEMATVEISQVKVSSNQRVALGNISAIEVAGTYTLKGGNLSRTQRQQTRPFDIYLQQGPEKEQWQLLEPQPAGQQPAWKTIPLS